MTKNPPPVAIAGSGLTVMLDPAEIAPSPTNPRKTFPESTLLELADSMAHDGQVQAILVRKITADAVLKWNKDHPDADNEQRARLQYELVSGERRWRAAAIKGLQLRAEVRELTDLQVVRIQIIENLHREEVHPLEEAEGYEYLLKHSGEKISVEQIADEVGKSKSYVLKRMKLAALCDEARKQFLAGEFDASTALLIARMATPDLQLKAIKEISELGRYRGDDYKPSYREIRDHLARRFHLELESAPFDIRSDSLVAGRGSCTTCPKRTGNQPALFEDVPGKDICTDPDCFGAKKTAAIAATIAEARSKGAEIIEGEKAKELAPHSSYWIDGHTYVDDVAFETEDGAEVTYRDLLAKAGKKAPKPKLFVDPKHPDDVAPKWIITDDEAETLSQKYAPKQSPAVGRVSDAGTADESPEDKAAREAQAVAWRADRIERETARLAKEELLTKADASRTAADLILIIFALVSDEISTEFMEALGVELPDDDAQRDFDYQGTALTALQGKTPAELGALAFRLALGDLGTYTDVPDAAIAAAAAAHGINVQTLRKQAERAVDNGVDGDDE